MKKILLVDDSAEARAIMGILLSEFGYVIYEACSGEEALFLLGGNQFDLIISDLEMPNGCGRWLLNELRMRSYKNEVIILSGDISADEKILKHAGASAFFSKAAAVKEIMDFILGLEESK